MNSKLIGAGDNCAVAVRSEKQRATGSQDMSKNLGAYGVRYSRDCGII